MDGGGRTGVTVMGSARPCQLQSQYKCHDHVHLTTAVCERTVETCRRHHPRRMSLFQPTSYVAAYRAPVPATVFTAFTLLPVSGGERFELLLGHWGAVVVDNAH